MSFCKDDNFYSNGRRIIKRTKRLKETTRDRHLFWNNFYSSKNFGLWIECTKCKKWRKSFQYHESHEVPEDWCCYMNITENGNVGNCEEPEESNDEEFFDYSPGSIVWAKLFGYPWWPGMIEVDPDVEEYFWKTQEHIFYNVTFLDEHVTRAWIPVSQICDFLKFPKILKCRSIKKKHMASIKKAEERANEALKISIKDRLENYSFANLYQGKWPRVRSFTEEIENSEDLTDALLKEVEEIDLIHSTNSEESDFEEDSNKNKMTKVTEISSQNTADFVKSTTPKERVKESEELEVLQCALSPNCKQENIDEKKTITKSEKEIKILSGEVNILDKEDKYSLTKSPCFETENIHKQKNDDICMEDEDTLELKYSSNTKTNSSISETIEEVIRKFGIDRDNNLGINFCEKTKKIKSSITKNNLEEMKQNKRKSEVIEPNLDKSIEQNDSSESDTPFKAVISTNKAECKGNNNNTVNNNQRKEIKKNKKLKCSDLFESSRMLGNYEKKDCLEIQNTTVNLKPKPQTLENSKQNIKKVKTTKRNKDLSETSLIKSVKNETTNKTVINGDRPDHKIQICLNEKSDRSLNLNKSSTKSKPLFKSFKQPLKYPHERCGETFSTDTNETTKPDVSLSSFTCNGFEMTPCSDLNSIKSSPDKSSRNLEYNECVKILNNLGKQIEVTSGNRCVKQTHFNEELMKNETSFKTMNKDKICKQPAILKQSLTSKSHSRGVPGNVTSKCSKLKNVKYSKMQSDKIPLKENKNKRMVDSKISDKMEKNFQVITIDDTDDIQSKIKSETFVEDDNCFIIPVSDEEP